MEEVISYPIISQMFLFEKNLIKNIPLYDDCSILWMLSLVV